MFIVGYIPGLCSDLLELLGRSLFKWIYHKVRGEYVDLRLVLTNFYLVRVKHQFLSRPVSSSRKNISESIAGQEEYDALPVKDKIYTIKDFGIDAVPIEKIAFNFA